jgi:Ca2+-binding EF-hand superfamily protein
VPNELMPMLQRADQNGDRAIDRQELAAAMANMRNQFGPGPGGPWPGGFNGPAGGRNDQQATGEFFRYDRNGDGRLTEDELPANAKRMLNDADANGDGALDAGELQAALAKMGDRSRLLRAGLDPNDPGSRGFDRDHRRAGSQR